MLIFSSSNLTAPIPRGGFHKVMVYNQSVLLKPLEVYVNAIQLMSVLSKLDWDGDITDSMSVTDLDYATECALFPLPEGSPLENDVAVIGLYQAGMAIAQQNAFYQADALLFVDDDVRGMIRFSPRIPRPQIDNALDVDVVGASDSNVTLSSKSGVIYDPKDKKFGITWTFDGVRIRSSEIFTAFMNAFAIAAQHPNHRLDAHVSAAPSVSGDVIFSSWTIQGFESARMSWARLKRALLVIWERIVIDGLEGRPIFEGFEFGLEYKGVKIGAGRLIKIDGAVNGTDATAIA